MPKVAQFDKHKIIFFSTKKMIFKEECWQIIEETGQIEDKKTNKHKHKKYRQITVH